MSKLRVHCFAVSADGYGAGPNQSLDNPLGVGGMDLHKWMLGTRTFQQMHGMDGGATGVDDDFVARGVDNIGAWILPSLGYRRREHVATADAMHVVFGRE